MEGNTTDVEKGYRLNSTGHYRLYNIRRHPRCTRYGRFALWYGRRGLLNMHAPVVRLGATCRDQRKMDQPKDLDQNLTFPLTTMSPSIHAPFFVSVYLSHTFDPVQGILPLLESNVITPPFSDERVTGTLHCHYSSSTPFPTRYISSRGMICFLYASQINTIERGPG